MIGRGIQGRPWLLAQIAHALWGGAGVSVPEGSVLSELVLDHYTSVLEFYGPDLGRRVARKHLGWYMDTAGTPPELRRAVLTCNDPGEVCRLLPAALSGSDAGGMSAA